MDDPAPQGRAADDLLPLVYDELRKIADRRLARLPPGQTLQATALVNEAYLKLHGEREGDWPDQRFFFVAAARAMRNILVDRARSKGALRHGGAAWRVSVEADDLVAESDSEEFLALDAAIEALGAHDERKRDVVLLRYYAGLSNEDVARELDSSVATVERDWRYAKAWLRKKLAEE